MDGFLNGIAHISFASNIFILNHPMIGALIYSFKQITSSEIILIVLYLYRFQTNKQRNKQIILQCYLERIDL